MSADPGGEKRVFEGSGPLHLVEKKKTHSEDVTLKLQPIIYKGTALKLKVVNENIKTVVLRIMKTIYGPKLKEIQNVINEFREPCNKDIQILLENIDKFNKVAKTCNKLMDGSIAKSLGDWALSYCTQGPAIQITNLAYECAITTPGNLNNHYKSFSSETYGETNLEQMASILNELQLGPNDVFVDMGSGVGHLVCFTAALAKVKKAVGIELSSLPASHAVEMQVYFKSLMSHFGKSYSPFELHKGDFLDMKFRDLILNEATVIFVNNYAFLPDLTVKIINELICELKEGVRIVSTKEFGVIKREINERNARAEAVEATDSMSKTTNATDISSILDMRQMNSVHDAVSWTANSVNFWLHRVDRTKVEEFYSQRAGKRNGKEKSSSATPSSSSREGSVPKDKESKRTEKEGSSDSGTSSTSSLAKEPKHPVKRAHKEEVVEKIPKEEFPAAPPVSVQSSLPVVSNVVVTKTELKDCYDDDQVFYGRTTRQMWKAQVGMIEKKPEPVNSPKYSEKEDYTPVTKKQRKPMSEKKKKVPVTPKVSKQQTVPQHTPVNLIASPPPPPPPPSTRHMSTTSTCSSAKIASVVNKIDPETMSVINQMHENTVQNTQMFHPPDDDVARGELIRVPVNQINQQNLLLQQLPHQQHQSQPTIPQPPVQLVQSTLPTNPLPLPSQNMLVAALPPTNILPPTPQPPPPPPTQVVHPPLPVSIPGQLVQPQPLPQVIPAQQLNNVPAMELATDQRHTFMIPPTDPLYGFTVQMYMDMKSIMTKAQQNDHDFKLAILQDMEMEKIRNAELNEFCNAAFAQIEENLSKGVVHLKDRLQELDMSKVQEVSELLHGSKQIVALHKSLTQKLANMEALVAQEEQKAREFGLIGEKGIEYTDQLIASDEFDIIKLERQINAWKAASLEVLDPNIISPNGSSSVTRRNRPRQRTGTTNRRSGNGQPEESEEVEREIQQFVQQALKIENMVKDKERRQRGSTTGTSTEKTSRKASANPNAQVAALPPTVGQHIQQQQQQQQKPDPSLTRSGPLIP